jgi:uncharacterized protein
METLRRGQTNPLNLTGEKCPGCQVVIYPPRDVCPAENCRDKGDREKDSFELSGCGTVYSHSEIFDQPTGYERSARAPYTIALIRLAEGPMLTAQITDHEGVKIGDQVEAVTRKLSETDGGHPVYGIKFRPRVSQNIKNG